jgi:hypothetical protein
LRTLRAHSSAPFAFQAGRAQTGAIDAALPYRVLSVACAVALGVTVWEFTSQRWADGITWALLVALMAAAYVIGERRRRTGKKGGRRY